MDNVSSCLPLAVHNFPKDVFDQESRRQGAVLVHFLCSVYVFGSLAYLCDTYFVPALEVLSDKLDLRPDVAGATFMAIGSSSPELFTSIVGVFIAKDDVGLGAIVGSAVFNIMFVIGCCIFVTPGTLYVEVWPIVRDSSYYCIALIPIAIVAIDKVVEWYEALALVLMYCVYIIVMRFNGPLEDLFYRLLPVLEIPKLQQAVSPVLFETSRDSVSTPISYYQSNGIKVEITVEEELDNDDEDKTDLQQDDANANAIGKQGGYLAIPDSHGNTPNRMEEHEHEVSFKGEESSFSNELTLPEGCLKRVLWVIGLPMVVLFAITLPNPANPKWAHWFPLTFILSLVYIGSLSYILVWMVTIIGYTIGIPDIIMGLVFLAAGASVPDALASIIVAKDGYGKMSVSNCIGSNIFDILLGLGLPWLLKTLVTDYGTQVNIQSSTIHFTIFILIGSVIALLLVFSVSKWKLRRPAGVFLVLLYVIFVTISCLLEMNVFGNYNPPSCTS